MAVADTIISMQNNLKNAYDSVESKGGKLEKLPSEYQEVEYIESTGTQYIDTGIKGSTLTNILVEYMLKSGGQIFGERDNWLNNEYGLSRTHTYFGAGYEHLEKDILNKKIVYEIKNKKFIIDGVITNNYNNTPYFISNSNIYLFAENSKGISVSFSSGILYKCSMTYDDVEVRNFIPCYRKIDGEIGLYDLVNSVFYTNQGTETFLKGNDVLSKKNLQNLSSVIDSIDSVDEYFDSETAITSSSERGFNKWITKLPNINYGVMTEMYAFFSNTQIEKINFLDTSKVQDLRQCFFNCKKLIDLCEIDCGNVGYGQTYRGVNGMFNGCSNLTNIGGLKDLGKSYYVQTENYNQYKLVLSHCTKLTHDSLMNIINNLYDLNLTYDVANGGTLYTQHLVLGSTNLAKLTDEEKAIATNKGWVLE